MTDEGGVTMLERPFVVLGTQQVAIGAADKRRLTRLWVEIPGWRPRAATGPRRRTSMKTSCRSPRDDSMARSTWCSLWDADAKPRVNEPALNHIGPWVDDLAAAYDRLSAKGVRFAAGGIRKGTAGHDVCELVMTWSRYRSFTPMVSTTCS